MASQHGGYRKPANPAAVSGPGALSRRTDGAQPMTAPTGMDYGDHKALLQQEATAPMPQDSAPATPSIPAAPQGVGPAPYTGPGLTDPSQRPDEPITHGVDIGAGGGPEVMPAAALPPNQPDGYITNLLNSLSPTDSTGLVAQLLLSAQSRGV